MHSPLQDVDIVFAYATKYSAERGIYLTELSRKLLDLKSGAKVVTTLQFYLWLPGFPT